MTTTNGSSTDNGVASTDIAQTATEGVETMNPDIDNECPRPVFSTPIEKLLFLPARDRGHDTASLLAAGSDGVVRAWCISAPGSYVGGFTASHHPDESVPAMAVDETNDLLVTGDACGYVKVWDISHFAVRERHCCDEEHRKRDAVWRDFPLLRWIKRLEEMGTGTLHKAFPTMQTAHEHDQPHLLTSVRAHVACINSVEYASLRSDERFILTASDDHSVRMWSLRGQFMGLFGQPALWDLNRTLCLRSERKEYMRHRPRSYLLPPDVRRCASTTTLRTLNNFKKTTWRGLACIVSCAQQFLEAGKRYREIDRPASVGKSSQSVHLKELPTPVLGHNFPRLPRHFTAKVARPVIFGHLCPAFHSIPLPAVEYVDFTPYTNMLKATRDRYQFSQHARLPPIRTGHGNPQRQALTRRYTVTHGHVGDHGHPGDHGHVRVHGHGHGHARMVGHAGDHDHAGDRGPPYDHDYAGAHGDTGAYGHAGDNAQRH
ncbi:hypothetical protein LSAT2_024359 [Lamellibrachia satsuma]|nr:hypothetical protein LSAT2_024359 [Lamellibrachia satsuma]